MQSPAAKTAPDSNKGSWKEAGSPTYSPAAMNRYMVYWMPSMADSRAAGRSKDRHPLALPVFGGQLPDVQLSPGWPVGCTLDQLVQGDAEQIAL